MDSSKYSNYIIYMVILNTFSIKKKKTASNNLDHKIS